MKVYEYKDDKISKSGKKNHLLVLETSHVNSHGRKMYIIFGFYHREYKGEFIDHISFDNVLYPKSRRVREETIIIKNINFNILSKENISHIIKSKKWGHLDLSSNKGVKLGKIILHNSILIENKAIINSKGQCMRLTISNKDAKFFKKKRDLKFKTTTNY